MYDTRGAGGGVYVCVDCVAVKGNDGANKEMGWRGYIAYKDVNTEASLRNVLL